MNTCFELFNGFIWLEMDFLLTEQRTVIHALIGNQVNHNTSMFYITALIGFIGTFDGMKTRERSGQSWMEVDDAVREMFEEGGGEESHPAGQNYVVRYTGRHVHSQA